MHKFDTSKFTAKLQGIINDHLILAGQHTVSEIKKWTPVKTGNLINTTGKDRPINNKIKVFQNAEYALWVELTQFHFSYGIETAKPTVKSLLRNMRTERR